MNTAITSKALKVLEVLQDEDFDKICQFILSNNHLYSDIPYIVERYLDANYRSKPKRECRVKKEEGKGKKGMRSKLGKYMQILVPQ
jgi:hypothetical protein